MEGPEKYNKAADSVREGWIRCPMRGGNAPGPAEFGFYDPLLGLDRVVAPAESAFRSKADCRLRASAVEKPEYWRGEWQRLGIVAREKAYLYDEWLEEGFLEQGMVVNRHSDGRPSGECDSLLFSSLRYTALMKLRWNDKAYQAWRGSQKAFQNGCWVRHPKCRRKCTSEVPRR